MNYLSKENVQEVLELSLIQERMIQTDRPLEEGGDLVQVVLTLQGEVEPQAFQTAWELVIQSHPGLRSVFRTAKNRTVQVVLKQRPIDVEIRDLRSLQPAERNDALTECTDRQWQPIIISDGPLMRLALLLVDEETSIFIWTYHALLLDDHSRERVLADVEEAYQAVVAGGGWAKKPDASFKGYLQWLKSEDWTPAQSFWKKQLSGFQAPTQHLEGVRPQQATARWERKTLTLSPALTSALEEMAGHSQVSWQAVPHAAWTILLQVYSGEDEIAFGSWTSGRACVPKEMTGVVRPLAQLVPFRLQADGESSLPALLKQVDDQLQQMEKFGFLPMEDAIPSYTSTLTVSESCSPLQVRREQPGSLHVHLKRGVAWELELQYANHLVADETVDQMQAHWQALLESMVQQPSARLCELNLLPEQECQALFVDFNQTLLPAPNLDTLAHHVVEAQVAARPNQIAVSCGDERVTYRELNERANRLAHWLREQGFGRDDLAGLFAERSIEMLVAILAVLKAGGAYVPLDSAHPDARIGTVLANSQVKVLLTQKDLAARCQSLAKELAEEPIVFCLNAHGGETDVADVTALAVYSPENLISVNEPQDLANVFYTSGSTGLPKGAMVEHIGMLNHLWAKINVCDLKEGCIVSQNASHCFDISVWQFVAPLMVGGQVAIYPNEIAIDPRALFEAVRKDGVTVLEMVPAVIESFLQAAAEQEPGDRALPRLKYMMSTGEGLSVSLCQKWLEEYPAIRVVNAYGATETSDDFAHATLDPDSNLDGLTHAHLGTTIPNFKIYLLDRWQRPVPIGVVGEVCTTGIGVGRGYLNDPERTALAFVANPFEDGMGERMYKTGDLARYLPDGRLAYVQRKDFQVKVRGHRIELGEIEAGLLRHPAVNQCIAVVTPDTAGENRIVAYVVSGQPVDQDELRRFLAESVPEYMIPAHLMMLPELPLNANGKVDRKKLPSPEETELMARSIVPPRNEEEARLVTIWEEVLGVAPIGIDDNFFTLGGHSLRTIQVRSRIKSRFGIDIPLPDLFDNQTIRDLAPLIQSGAATAEESGPVKLAPAEFYSMSHAQQRLYFLQQLNPENRSYNMPMAVTLRGSLQVDALIQAFQIIVDRHEVLRTTFHMVDDQPMQRVHAELGVSCPLVDLSQRSEENRHDEMLKLVCKNDDIVYDLEAGPLYHLEVVKMQDDEHVLLLNMHHIITDQMSWRIVFQEFGYLYSGLVNGEEPSLPALSLQYADYAHWQNERLRTEHWESDAQYWLNQLAGELPILNLPAEKPRPPIVTQDGHSIIQQLDSNLSRRLHALAEQHDTTLFMALLAVTGAFLSRLSGQNDIIIGTPAAGRNRMEWESLIGLFVNTLPLRLAVDPASSFTQLLEQCKQTAMEAYEHEEFPFDVLVDRLNLERDLSRSPIFSVLFQVVRQGDTISLPNLELAEWPFERGTAQLDLMIQFAETETGLQLSFTYRTDLYEADAITRWIHALEVMMSGVTQDAEQKVSRLPLLTERDLHQQLVAWNDTAVDYPQDATLPQLFTQQVERTPDEIAVVYEDQQLTYRELNQRVNQVAHVLREQGIGAGAFVGVFAERSLEMVIGLYAIVNAGGAYVPLDPTYPQERLSYMVEDTGMNVILTQTHLLDRLPETSSKVLCLDDLHPWWADQHAGNPSWIVQPEDPAYLIYTSGSTGRPKGVIIPHRGIVNRLLWMQDEYVLGPDDRVLQKTPFGFDVSVWEFFWPLLAGARLVVARPEGHKDSSYLVQMIEDHQITTLHFVPSMLRAFLEEEDLTGCGSLRQVFASGEALPHDLQQQFQQRLQSQLHNLYGPTEASVDVTYWNCRLDENEATVPIGRPVANTRIYILDEHRLPLPVGVPGELHIGGVQLASGYLNRPDLTEAAFVPDPFHDAPGARMYKTGDLARYRPDGAIEYLGRLDHQVKVRGFRIELGEIETLLLQQESVHSAVVIVREDTPGDKLIVAYVVPADEQASVADWRTELAEKLPEHMVPDIFVTLQEFPINPNGKVDRKALPQPDLLASAHQGQAYMPPRDSIEAEITRIWEDILHVRPIAIYDNFFTIGGNSLKALSMIGRINHVYRLHLPVAHLFKTPTIASMAGYVRLEGSQAADGVLLIQQGEAAHPPLFLIHSQGGGIMAYFHLANELGPEHTVYGVQAIGYETDEEPLATMEEMVERYYAEIKHVAPQGPYRLGGWSFGGSVAYELARRFETAGDEVEFVGLFDTHLAGDEQENAVPFWTNREVLMHHANLVGLWESDVQELDNEQLLDLLIERAGEQLDWLPGADREDIWKKIRVMASNGNILNQYRYQRPLQADLHMFLVASESKVGHGIIDAREWKDRTKGETYVYQVSGDHLTMFDPEHMTHLTEEIRNAFQSTARKSVS